MKVDKTTEIQQQVLKLNAQVAQLSATNSNILDEVATLKSNYTKLVSDLNTRLEMVHQKVFRP
jgi:cell division protein FtsB